MGFGSGGGGIASPRVPGSPILDGLRGGRSGRPPFMNGRPSLRLTLDRKGRVSCSCFCVCPLDRVQCIRQMLT